MLRLRTIPVALLAALAGCGGEAPAPVAPPAASTIATPAAPPATASASAAAAPAHSAFENPGGMWMPEQIAAQAATLKSIGLEIDPNQLATPTSDVLGAVVSLGGCSASFISPDGLIATNHHCAISALQYNSTPQQNLLRDGFLARTRADERWNGPSARVFVTQSIRDVTKEVREGLESIKDDAARYKQIEAREKALVAACEKDKPSTRCSVASFFGGAQHRLIEQLEIKDVRLAWAPHEGVGDFGGEVDNWRWPRHGGDVTFFRAYVGKDGKPADHSPENVPYKPPRWLKVASKPLKAGDLVMVAGYPAQTNRLRTAGEVDEAVSWLYPHRIRFAEEGAALLEALAKTNAEVGLKATPLIRGLNNGLTKYRGIQEGLTKGGLAKGKAAQEAALRRWIDADPARKAKYGDVLDKMGALFAERRKTREEDAALGELLRLVTLASSTSTIVRMAEERPKPDAERDPAYQQRNWQRLEQADQTAQKRYDRGMDRALFKLVLQRAARLPKAERPGFLALVVGRGEPTDAAIDKALGALYSGTKLETVEARLKLLQTATTADLQKSKDPMLQLALKLRPMLAAMEQRDKAFAGALELLRPRYVEALEAFDPKPLAPDANSTLRLTYGTVRGYSPAPGAPEFRPFTVLSEMIRKNTGKDPFEAPAAVLAAARDKKFGPYVDSDLGEVPIDFLSDLDITGGNSGSATLNGRGELVGLAFDGNYEAMASDWLFLPKITRTIHVDLRYVLWLLDAVYQGDHLLAEIGVKAAVN